MENIVNNIFIAGWYISASFVIIQAIKIFKLKNGSGISLIANLGFFLLNINSSIWMYLHHEYWCIIGTGGISIGALICFILAIKYGNRGKYKAVIFDLDGTLFDTQTPVHARAECEVLGNNGVAIKPENISQRFAGIPTRKVFQELAPHLDTEVLIEKKWQNVRAILKANHPEPIEMMDRLLAYLSLKKTPVIIASASPKWYIELLLQKNISGKNLLRHTPLKKYFLNNFISAEEVTNPKPAPDIFLEAARRLNVEPKQCLVIGDGKSDIQGGLAAGMDVVFLGEADEEIHLLRNVISFSRSSDLVAYLIKEPNLF